MLEKIGLVAMSLFFVLLAVFFFSIGAWPFSVLLIAGMLGAWQ